MRRRDNIQAEFEAKNEALASRKVDQEAVRALFNLHTLTEKFRRTHTPLLPPPEQAGVFVRPPVVFPEIRCNKVEHVVVPIPKAHPQAHIGEEKGLPGRIIKIPRPVGWKSVLSSVGIRAVNIISHCKPSSSSRCNENSHILFRR